MTAASGLTLWGWRRAFPPGIMDAHGSQAGVFPSTHWSVVLAAGGEDSPRAQQCLETLCQRYWYPMYAFVRHRGHSPEDAQDLVQGFFAQILEKGVLTKVQPKRGRFRSFLLTCLSHYLSRQWNRAATQRRGGGFKQLPLDVLDAEARYAEKVPTPLTPEELFERAWALGVLAEALAKLRAEYALADRVELFDALEPHLSGSRPLPHYRQLADRWGLTESALRMMVARLRRRYGELLRLEISHTVATTAEIDQELQDLMAALKPKA